MAFDLADRGIYGFSTSENLRFADVDANGHVNNGAFMELLENALDETLFFGQGTSASASSARACLMATATALPSSGSSWCR
ncbi:MAG: hypothetical protein HYZ40_03950 [Rhodospirillales bacterium]|nr:hypothetical protein [Rhodospirillales bacterium]